jgi:hypothetical protein
MVYVDWRRKKVQKEIPDDGQTGRPLFPGQGEALKAEVGQEGVPGQDEQNAQDGMSIRVGRNIPTTFL